MTVELLAWTKSSSIGSSCLTKKKNVLSWTSLISCGEGVLQGSIPHAQVLVRDLPWASEKAQPI